MNAKIAEAAMTTLVAMSQAPENFTATEIKNFYANVIAKLPCFVFWKDKDFKYVFCNEITAVDLLKLNSPSEIVGKTDFDFGLEPEAAQWIRQTDEDILRTGKPLLNTEVTVRMRDGRIVHVSSNRMPLFDNAGEAIGIIGISVDITAQKEAEQLRLKVEAETKNFYDNVMAKLPCLVFWKDKDFKYVFCNEITAVNFLKLNSPSEIVGKTDFDFGWDLETVKWVRQTDEEILRTRKPLLDIEVIVKTDDGRNVYLSSNRMPLFDSTGEAIGIIGISVDITAQKEKELLALENERLKFENATQQAVAQEQEKFKKAADQIAHDIRSPISTVLMIAKVCQEIPEPQRIALREAAHRANDIANNLISRFKKKDDEKKNVADEEREPVLVSTALSEILTEKKYHFQGQAIRINHHFSQAGHFSWIDIQPNAFKRMLSNLINNAADAFDGNAGTITVDLDADRDAVSIIIEDDGKGMPPALLQKIKSKIVVSEGKSDGHGIGLGQVHDTLDNNNGQWQITSEAGQGTRIVLTFPRGSAQNWIAESIQLYDDDTLVVLDDDSSIHSAWGFRFDKLHCDFPEMKIIHHEKGQDTIDLINGLTPEAKQNIFLLSDYELLKQDVNGLQVIAQTRLDRSILVTSHYRHRKIHQEASKTHTKILPKQLAAEVPIHITRRLAESAAPELAMKKVDAVFVDDEQPLLDSYQFFAMGKLIDTYSHPEELLNRAYIYPKQTKFLLDQNYTNSLLKGIDVAGRLHENGFTRLYLLTGETIIQAPDYLTVVHKTDLDGLTAALAE